MASNTLPSFASSARKARSFTRPQMKRRKRKSQRFAWSWQLETRPAFVYAEDKQQAEQLRREADAAASLGLRAEFLSDADLP